MTEKPTIVAFGPGTWRHPEVFGSPRYHLWSLAERGWRVVYTEPPVSMRLAGCVWRAPDRDFHVIGAGAVLPFAVRMTHGDAAADLWRRFTSRQLARRALAYIHSQGIIPDVYWFGAPWHGGVSESLPEGPLRVAHCYDELALSPALTPRQQERLWKWEQELLRRCDVSLCSSMPQLARREGLARRTALLENAIPDSFLDASRGMTAEGNKLLARLEALPRPRFVYGGVADHRLDPACFSALLDDERVGSVAILGKLDANTDTALAEMLRTHPKAHLFGSIPHSAYPHLLRAADCLVLLHKRTPFTDAMNPEKLNEYLATGRAILSVALPEVVRVVNPAENPGLVTFVESPGEISSALRRCLGDSDAAMQAARRRLAAQRTWAAAALFLDAMLRGEFQARHFERS